MKNFIGMQIKNRHTGEKLLVMGFDKKSNIYTCLNPMGQEVSLHASKVSK